MNWLKNIFTKHIRSKKSETQMKITTDQAKKMLQMIENTQDSELTCDEVLDLLDQYAEMALRGEDVTAFFPLVKHHLEMCPDCKEEFEALMRILETQVE
jgi:hypothetical protein